MTDQMTSPEERGFWTLGRIVVLILAILVIALAIANYRPVTLNLLLRTFEVQLTWLILGSLLVGYLAGWLGRGSGRKKS
ncbi:MAG TPA: LapA family protein [Candidatus Limnocylindria bacterium]